MEIELASPVPCEEVPTPPGTGTFTIGEAPDVALSTDPQPNNGVVNDTIELGRVDSSRLSAVSGGSASRSTDKSSRLGAVQVVASYTDIWMLGEIKIVLNRLLLYLIIITYSSFSSFLSISQIIINNNETGITIVVGGQYFVWNEGLKAGFGGFLVAGLITMVAYTCLCFCIAEMTSVLPFSGIFNEINFSFCILAAYNRK